MQSFMDKYAVQGRGQIIFMSHTYTMLRLLYVTLTRAIDSSCLLGMKDRHLEFHEINDAQMNM